MNEVEFSNRNMKIMAVLGLAGGLLGYGIHGNIQAACIGSAIGLLTMPALFLFLCVLP